MKQAFILAGAFWVSMAYSAFAQDPQPPATDALPSQTHVVVVRGADGTTQMGEQFGEWVSDWKTATETADAQWTLIGESSNDETTDRERLKSAIESIPPGGAQPLWIVLIGHGTFTGNVAKFNLRGPDVSAQDVADWLKPFQRPLVVINCTSSSSPFINRLSGNNRVIVTATKSGSQYNYARFGEYFARAIASSESDLDHDDEVSVLEAFLRASNDVKAFYQAADRISTENALIDDNGDSRGTPAKMFRGVRIIAKAKDNAKPDGRLGSRITLSPVSSQLPFTDEELRQRDQFEQELDAIRDEKPRLTKEQYDQKIEPILVGIAKLYQAAESRAAK